MGKKSKYKCVICGNEYEGMGNNPTPIKEHGKCCDECNENYVLPARIKKALLDVLDEDEGFLLDLNDLFGRNS